MLLPISDGGREETSTMPTGQFYAVSVDMRKPYYVCGGLQDNGSWCGPARCAAMLVESIDWYSIGGGDGFYTANDPSEWTIGYSESQDGTPAATICETVKRTASGREGRLQGRGGGGAGAGAAQPTTSTQAQQAQQAQTVAQERRQQSGRTARVGRRPRRSAEHVPPPPTNKVSLLLEHAIHPVSTQSEIVYLGGDRLFRSTAAVTAGRAQRI